MGDVSRVREGSEMHGDFGKISHSIKNPPKLGGDGIQGRQGMFRKHEDFWLNFWFN